MLTRRDLFRGLAALPLLRYLEPLARWMAPAQALSEFYAFERPVGCHLSYLVFDDIEDERVVVSMAELARYTVENKLVPWEDRGQELLPWHPDSLVDRLLEKGRS